VTDYVTCALENISVRRIGLIAVSRVHRGLEIGQTLLDSALSFFMDTQVKHVHVVTQVGNVPAIRLYEKSGFNACEAGIWLHKWSSRSISFRNR
jgi:dTDP-4-amino-4,6-dideoxy-D-galactose acyltransferase